VEPNLRLADGVPPLQRIVEGDGLPLVEGSDHRSGRYEDHSGRRVVLRDETRVERAVRRASGSDEVDDRNRKRECLAQRAVIRLLARTRSVRVAEAEIRRLVRVGRPDRRLDRESRRAALHARPVNPLLVVQEGHARAAKVEPLVQRAGVRKVLAELRAQDVEREEARRANVLVELHYALPDTSSPARRRRKAR
jgi:hypothetical protein